MPRKRALQENNNLTGYLDLNQQKLNGHDKENVLICALQKSVTEGHKWQVHHRKPYSSPDF